MKRANAFLVIITLTMLAISALALNNLMIRVKIKTELAETIKEVNKLKVDIIPEDVVIGERIKIIVRDLKNNPVKGARVYVIEDYYNASAKRTYIGETNSKGELVHIFEGRGWYGVYVEKEEYSPQQILIYVRPKGYLSISIKFPYADLEKNDVNKWLAIIYVTSNHRPVEEAEVYINGKLVGYTNSDGQLSYIFKPGKVYTIVVKKRGYVPCSITLNIKSGN